jgi:hypothetical protein
MKKLNNQMKLIALVAITAMVFTTSCNKDLEQLDPINTTVPLNPVVGTIGQLLNPAVNPNDSLFYKLLVRSTLLPLLNDSTKRFTIFAVDNAGMRIFASAVAAKIGITLPPSGAPESAYISIINGLPVKDAAGIVSYITIGQQYLSSSWANSFPNLPLPSQIQLDTTGATPFLRMTICPSINNGINYVNNIPIFNPAIGFSASNGVIHQSYSIAAPPTRLLRDTIARDTALVYFRAAILRGDFKADTISPTHPVIDSTKFFDYLMGYGALNMTVMAPNNAAMRAAVDSIIYPNVYNQVYAQVYPVVYSNVYNAAIALMLTPAQATAYATANSPAIAAAQSTPIAHANSTATAANPNTLNLLPVSAVRGIVAYHILASNGSGSFKPDVRLFSVNIPTTAGFVKTLINGSSPAAAVHPGIRAVATFSLATPTSVKLTGFGILKEGYGADPLAPPNPNPYTGASANVIAADKHGVNGIYHVIDRVLLPK